MLSPSTTSTAGSVRVEPTSPVRRSTVRTSSTDAFSCLPPQRTIAYTETLFPLSADPPRFPRQRTGVPAAGVFPARPEHAEKTDYQTAGVDQTPRTTARLLPGALLHRAERHPTPSFIGRKDTLRRAADRADVLDQGVVGAAAGPDVGRAGRRHRPQRVDVAPLGERGQGLPALAVPVQHERPVESRVADRPDVAGGHRRYVVQRVVAGRAGRGVEPPAVPVPVLGQGI